MRKLYNLFWDSGLSAVPAPVAVRRANLINAVPRVPGIILYPAFFTPGILFLDAPNPSGEVAPAASGPCFELLILGDPDQPITEAMVNRSLGIAEGLQPRKRTLDQPLFPDWQGRIAVQRVEPDANGVIATHSTFRGILHPAYRTRFPESLRALYRVRVSADALTYAYPPEGAPPTGRITLDLAPAEATGAILVRETRELQDLVISTMISALHGTALRHGHCFAAAGRHLSLERFDEREPLVAYHPLVVFPKGNRVEALGHISDLHLNARQGLLERSPARVIEHESAGEIDEESPAIGTRVHRYDRSVSGILGRFPGDAQLIVVGGDLVDHIRNAFPEPGKSMPRTAKDVWDAVRLDRDYAARYHAFTDFVAAFSIFLRLYRSRRVPVLGVTGNHDCYLDGYGISPRVLGQRANEGIPADHNLTFYEAILAFGPTWHELRRVIRDNFQADYLEWFHTALTPFADAAIELPHQTLVGLGWGNAEHLLEAFSGSLDRGQGLGFLPRSVEAVSDPQLRLLQSCYAQGKAVILTTHFTFASFNETIPTFQPDPQGQAAAGAVRRSSGEIPVAPDQYSRQCMGTFQRNRQAVYEGVLDPQNGVSCVLTGHSHRKAVYFLSRGGPPIAVTFPMSGKGSFEPDDPRLAQRTPIIVSDSAGPFPRRNDSNEFGAWGSDRPSGTMIRLGRTGRVRSVTPIHPSDARSAKPRAVVALDYRHVMDRALFARFHSRWVKQSMEPKVDYSLEIELTPALRQRGVLVARVALYVKSSGAAPWVRIGTHRDSGSDCWVVPEPQRPAFLQWATFGSPAGRFVSIQFSTDDPILKDRYNWTDHYNLEVWVRSEARGWFTDRERRYWIGDVPAERLSDPEGGRQVVEAPSFTWRYSLGAKYRATAK